MAEMGTEPDQDSDCKFGS